jgi:hypothetical protein
MAMGQGQGNPGGSAGDQSGGYGQAGTLSFKFTLTGYAWAWDSTEGDPRQWTGKATEPVLQVAEGYGSAADALEAGKVIGDANPDVMKVTVTPNMSGFAGASYTYTGRWQDAINAPGKEKDAAYEAIVAGGGTLDLGDSSTSAGSPWLGLIVIVLIIIAVLYFLPKIGPSKEIIAPVTEAI